MERKLGINISDKDLTSALNTLDILNEQGFNAFFTLACGLDFCKKIKESADEKGMCYEFIHATWDNINEMWTAEKTPKVFYDLKEQIEVCGKIGVNKLVMHLSSGKNAPCVSDIGFNRFDELVDFAQSKNVILAFENQRKLGNLSCLLERYEKSSHVGFCFDSGHASCFTQNVNFLDFWAEKVTCVHLHDNLGQKDNDQHLMPFDANVDFDYIMRKLNSVNYDGAIMLEIFPKAYPNLSKQEFFKLAFERAKKLSLIK